MPCHPHIICRYPLEIYRCTWEYGTYRCVEAFRHMGFPIVQGASECIRGVQTYGGIQMYGVHLNIWGHLNIWRYPNIWGHPDRWGIQIMGLSEYMGGIQTWGIQMYGGVWTYGASKHKVGYLNIWGTSKCMGLCRHPLSLTTPLACLWSQNVLFKANCLHLKSCKSLEKF